jgi:predicted nucleic acid-binding protein
VIDTFAWIEYFSGSEKGERARRYIEGDGAMTPTIVVAELTDKYVREGASPRERLKFIRSRSTILPLDDETAELAGTLSADRRREVKGWGLVDSVVLATARIRGAKVVTGDEHFRGLDEAIMLG